MKCCLCSENKGKTQLSFKTISKDTQKTDALTLWLTAYHRCDILLKYDLLPWEHTHTQSISTGNTSWCCCFLLSVLYLFDNTSNMALWMAVSVSWSTTLVQTEIQRFYLPWTADGGSFAAILTPVVLPLHLFMPNWRCRSVQKFTTSSTCNCNIFFPTQFLIITVWLIWRDCSIAWVYNETSAKLMTFPSC